MLCSNCGSKLNGDVKFCPNCGKEVLNSNTTNQISDKNNDEKVNVGLVILSFIIPLAGLIIFLTKKDNEPKTAKASGICALVSFILEIIAILVMFMIFSFVLNTSKEIVKEGGNTFNKIMDRVEDNIDKVTEDEDNDIEITDEWDDYEFVVNNKIIKLPCTYAQLTNATGFKMKSAQENSSLSSNYYTLVNMYKNDNLALYTEILNDTNSDIKYTEAKITRIGQTKYQVEKGADQIIFPGDIKVGDKITNEEIIDEYGEPTNKRDYSNNGYESVTYVYNANTNWTTTNYFEIKVVNGIIDEITLDNRNYK